jgi:hypothetical protein
MNPDNVGASTRRRVKLLAAFDSLPEDTRADLLELIETWAHSGTWNFDKDEARKIIAQVYAAAGL